MKRLFAAAALILFIAVSCTVGHITIGSCGEKMSKILTDASNLAEHQEYDKAKAQLKKAEEEYARQEWMLCFFVNHTLVKELGEQLAELPALANREGAEELISHIDSTKVKILHIIKGNRLSFANIF